MAIKVEKVDLGGSDIGVHEGDVFNTPADLRRALETSLGHCRLTITTASILVSTFTSRLSLGEVKFTPQTTGSGQT